MNQMFLTTSVRMFILVMLSLMCLGQACAPLIDMDLEAWLQTVENEGPMDAFDGEWGCLEHGFALEISNRAGVVTLANSTERKVGDLMLVILSVDDTGFTGRWMFMDGSVRAVTAIWLDEQVLSMTGGGWTWTLVLIRPAYTTLTVETMGEGAVDPAGETLAFGEEVTVSATAAEGWRFDRWEGDLQGGPFDYWRDASLRPANPAVLTMDEDKTITAVFVPRLTETETFDLGGGVTLKVIHIPGGTFLMGSSDEQLAALAHIAMNFSNEGPQHLVTVSDFAMGETEVTQAQFRALMGYVPDVPIDCKSDCFEIPMGDDLPAAWVDWSSAVAFCDALSTLTGRLCRLPTEAEWEYACRAGSTSAFFFGDSDEDLAQYAWFVENADCEGYTYGVCMHEVGQLLPNAFGLYDMHGNVWEWVGDWFGPYAIDLQTDPTGPLAGANRHKIMRGGAFQRFSWALRSAYRYGTGPTAQFNFGFRVVCE
ncbi:MAG: formylglycine-generating enzyme family protein [Phycisphaerales bacterium]|nr:formylglycine-generating enzyme family protein [Phycisphaerales bacterium]